MGAKIIPSYLDDIVIFSQTWDEHLKHLQDISEWIKWANITIKYSKCKLVKEEDYLECIVADEKTAISRNES